MSHGYAIEEEFYQMKKSINDDVVFGDDVTGGDLNVRLELEDSIDANVVLVSTEHVGVDAIEDSGIDPEPPSEVVQGPDEIENLNFC